MKPLLASLILFAACAAGRMSARPEEPAAPRVSVRYADQTDAEEVHMCVHEGKGFACVSLERFFRALQAAQDAQPKHEI